MSKVYRTSKGQNLDIGALLLSNENTRAVGNMGVNARGDKINSENKIIKSRNDTMTQHYRKTYNKHVQDAPVYKSTKQAEQAKAQEPVQAVKEPVQAVQEPTPQPVQQEPIQNTDPAPQKVPMTGLAGAIAKARSVEQQEEKTARQMQQEQEGVKRI